MPHASDRPSLRPVEFEILVTLGLEPMHGYAILKAAEARGGASPGMTTLYRALQRLHEDGLIEPVATDAEDERREVYALTAEGRRVASAEARRLHALLGVAGRAALLGGDSS